MALLFKGKDREWSKELLGWWAEVWVYLREWPTGDEHTMALVRLAWKCYNHAESWILVTEITPGFSLNHHFEQRNGAPGSSCTGPFCCTCGLLPLVEHSESTWKKQGGCIQALWARIWKARGWFYSLPWESLNSYNETTLPTTLSTRQLWLVILHLPSTVDMQ